MNEPFSIVIPVYNRASMICSTLNSVKAQSYRPIRLILVDNNSVDDTLNVLTQWAAGNRDEGFQISVTRQMTPGAAAARNKGLEKVNTEYMLFFDSDDILLPGAVDAYMKAFKGPEKPELVMARSRMLDTGTGKSRLMPLRGGDRLVSHIHHATLRTQGYAAKTELFRRVGGWDEQTLIWDDWELGIRLLSATDRIMQIPDVTCEIVVGHESLTGLKYSDRSDLYEAPLLAAERDLHSMPKLAALMDYRRMMLAAHFAREGDVQQALKLRNEVLSRAKTKHYTRRYRLLLRLAFHYIRLGGRGFDRLLSHQVK